MDQLFRKIRLPCHIMMDTEQSLGALGRDFRPVQTLHLGHAAFLVIGAECRRSRT